MLYINAGIYFLMALMIFPRNPPGRSPGVSPVAQQQQLAEARTLNQASDMAASFQAKSLTTLLINEAQNELELSAGSEDNEGIKERTGFRLERRVAAVGRHMGRGNGYLATIGAISDAANYDFAKANGIRLIFIEEFDERGPKEVMAEARAIVGDRPTYVSFDIDILDPSIAPGTGTPEIGGITSREAQAMIRLLRGLDIVGADLVEVSPPFDPSGATALTAATLMFELLCVMAEGMSRKTVQS